MLHLSWVGTATMKKLPFAVMVALTVAAVDAGAEGARVATLVRDLSAQDESVRLNAALTLGKVGKDAVAPVAALLQDQDDDVRYYAAWALGLIGPDARDKAPDVARLLGDK
ncbi:MAG TPA: HEAT repeat domain-containing protein, partial [Gemmataceae bacterium]|nr:HEAT repeat domain-containing protein [Gemmataceae bacterium]